MTLASDIRGTAFEQSTPAMLARLVGPAGQHVVPADLASCYYSIFQVDLANHDTLTPVDGHDDVELDVNEVFYDSLQTDAAWTRDAVGYNFRHDLDASANEPLPTAGLTYQVRYEATAIDGHRLVWRYLITVI